LMPFLNWSALAKQFTWLLMYDNTYRPTGMRDVVAPCRNTMARMPQGQESPGTVPYNRPRTRTRRDSLMLTLG
jgi:hypothetical protein